ncbi:hypothetical protein F4806DRAFT_497002 [Annulohypoxylon nitens]|nr:hypothetical protein F4806DRAFT_497002 [Annulohypoxylon nitens]
MSDKNVSDASKANGEGGAKSNKTWTNDETLKAMMLIWQHENRDLSVSGWKEIGEKAQTAFNGRFSMVALKHIFQRVRTAYMNDIPEDWKKAPKSNGDKAPAVSGKGKKRAAPSDDEPTVNSPKAKKQRAVKKATNVVKGASKTTATFHDNDEEEQMTADLKPQRRANPKSQTKDHAKGKATDDKPTQPTHRHTTRKNSQMAAVDSQSTNNTVEAHAQQTSDSDRSSESKRNKSQDVDTGDQAGSESKTAPCVTSGDVDDLPDYIDDEVMSG